MKRTVVITGPESSGKSELSQTLSEHLNCPWVPEYARWYLERLYREYRASDLLAISIGQQKGYYQTRSRFPHKTIILDTWAIVMMIWNKVKYRNNSSVIQSHLFREQVDLYLLCSPDLPWQEDPLREHPDNRWQLFEMYERMLQEHDLPYRIIKGKGEDRLQMALNHLSKLGIN